MTPEVRLSRNMVVVFHDAQSKASSDDAMPQELH
jgi:hypothetical protein